MLQDCDLMDYSLLIIVINCEIGKTIDSQNNENEDLEVMFREPKLIRRIFRSKNKKYVYCLGIIDYLQKYDLKKAIEHRVKRIVHDDKASAVDSKLYAIRLQKFVNKNILEIEIK